MSALTDLIDVVPPRAGHALSRVLGLSRAYAIFCPHCPDWEGFESGPEDVTGPDSTT